jgi:hypothetical protein
MGNSHESIIYNEEVPNSKEEGFTPIYRKKGIKNLKETPEESIRSIRDMIKLSK